MQPQYSSGDCRAALLDLLGFSCLARLLIVVEDGRAAVIYDPLRFFFFSPPQAHRFKTSQTFSHKRTSQTLWGEESVRHSLNLPCIWSEDVN